MKKKKSQSISMDDLFLKLLTFSCNMGSFQYLPNHLGIIWILSEAIVSPTRRSLILNESKFWVSFLMFLHHVKAWKSSPENLVVLDFKFSLSDWQTPLERFKGWRTKFGMTWNDLESIYTILSSYRNLRTRMSKMWGGFEEMGTGG